MSRTPARTPRPRCGLTLLEVTIVLAITAIASLLVLPRWIGPTPLADTPSGWFTVVLTDAASRARRDRQVVTVHVSPAGRRLVIDTAGGAGVGTWRDVALPDAVANALAPAAGDHGAATFAFHPGGAAFADTLLLREPAGRTLLTIDPGSGEVRRAAP